MKRSSKAALLSGLVFPGLGHLYLRRYAMAIILLLVAGWAIYSVLSTAVSTALVVAQEIEDGNIAPDPTAIEEMLARRSELDERSTNIPMLVLLVCWVIGIVDAYRIGRAQDGQATLPGG